jgi:hypothetical protein
MYILHRKFSIQNFRLTASSVDDLGFDLDFIAAINPRLRQTGLANLQLTAWATSIIVTHRVSRKQIKQLHLQARMRRTADHEQIFFTSVPFMGSTNAQVARWFKNWDESQIWNANQQDQPINVSNSKEIYRFSTKKQLSDQLVLSFSIRNALLLKGFNLYIRSLHSQDVHNCLSNSEKIKRQNYISYWFFFKIA